MIQSPAQTRALTSPAIDFWLLGGLSWLFLAVVWVIVTHYSFDPTDYISKFFFFAGFAVNYPHFAFSYQLFYDGFLERLRSAATPVQEKIRLMVAGIIVPAILIGYFFGCWFSRDKIVMGYGIAFMMFFVGWHYTKQGYGVLITMSVYKNVFYSLWQKRVLYFHAYVVWAFSWVRANASPTRRDYYDAYYYAVGVPENVVLAFKWAAILSGFLAAAVLLKAWLVDKKGISFNGLVGYASAIYLWIVASSNHVYFTAFLFSVPFFHSLQYLPFVYKFKKTQTAGDGARKLRRRVDFVLAGFVLGGLFLYILPNQIDKAFLSDMGFFTKNFYLLTCILLINIHHYFIDNAFWRRENEQVQKYLFRA